MIDLLASRVAIYHLLRDAFVYPVSLETLEALQGLQVDAETSSSLGDAIGLLKGGLAASPPEERVERVNREHSRLLAGPGLAPAPPYGSYYLDPEPTLFGRETARVGLAFRAAGFAPADPGTPADHITFELEFMAIQAGLALEAAQAGHDDKVSGALRSQRAFLRAHLLPLAKGLAESILRAEPDQTFQGLARLLEEYLFLDYELLDEMVETPPISRSASTLDVS
ncbi:MAG: molecular chaperone TorD family protein [Chloroflexi bacterium]|nr:molecular chaperone TorD family protein [Chloroflexota bacterium]